MQAAHAEAADRVADLEARLLGAQRDADAAERRAELAERQSAEAHRLILDMQVPALAAQPACFECRLKVQGQEEVCK
jgi:hypothetical protein